MVRHDTSRSTWFMYSPSASTRSDNNVFVASKINSSNEGGEGCKRADCLLETHCSGRRLILSISIRAKRWREESLTGIYPKRMDTCYSKGLLEEAIIVDLQDDGLIVAQAPPVNSPFLS